MNEGNPFAREPKQQSDLGSFIRDQATAMNAAQLASYEAGIAEGFRRGLDRAARFVDGELGDTQQSWIADAIRQITS